MIEPGVVAIWIGRFLLGTLATTAAWWLLKRTGPWLTSLVNRIDKRLKERGRGVSLVSVELVSLETILGIIRAGLGSVRYAAMFFTAYGWLLIVTWALEESHKVFDAEVQPLSRAATSLVNAVVDFIPNLAMVVVIVIVARFAARTIALLSDAIEEGRIEFPWLARDLVLPTRRLAIIAIWLVALVMAVPYLPGSESKAFFGVGLALAVILSLGSTSATSNLLGGLVITYTRAFHVGDRVRIGDVDGEITGLGAFSTRLRTTFNEDVVIPNAIVNSGTIKNYSSRAKEEGLQVSVSIHVSYDVPWRIVHEQLILAAKHVTGIKSRPEPFVLQRALGDSAVHYELRAHTDRAHEIEYIVARLHQSVQDAFFREGIEIASPHLVGTRDAQGPHVPASRKNLALEIQVLPNRAAPKPPVPTARDRSPSFVVIPKPPIATPPPPEKKSEMSEAQTEIASASSTPETLK